VFQDFAPLTRILANPVQQLMSGADQFYKTDILGRMRSNKNYRHLSNSLSVKRFESPPSESWHVSRMALAFGAQRLCNGPIHRTLVAIGLCIVLLSISSGSRPAAAGPSAQEDQVTQLLSTMTLEQKVGQLFLVSAYGPGVNETTAAFIRTVMPGGVALFGSNGTTPDQVTATVNAWQTLVTHIGANVPMLVATDQEGGPVTRLSDGFSPFPAGPALAAMPPADARIVGQVVGAELNAVGINTDLAPVTDVQTIISNPIMDGRSFGSDPKRVGNAAAAFNTGLDDSGVIGVLKHFPGHGDASDSHIGLPTVNDPLSRVESVELQSFRLAIQAGAEVVMVGHLVYPALDPVPNRPASLSPRVIQDVLRGELGFKGLVITDALDMGAVLENYTPNTAAVQALVAGVDVITTGPHLPLDAEQAMYQTVLDAARSGALPEARINEAVGRVLALKAKHGLLSWSPLDDTAAAARIHLDAHRGLLQPAFADAITIARNKNGLLPVHPGGNTVILFPGIYPATQRLCATYDPHASSFSYTQAPTSYEIGAAAKLAQLADRVIEFTYNAVNEPAQQTLVKTLPPDRTVAVALNNPYDFTTFPNVAGYVLSYTPTPDAFAAACNVLYGARPAVGVLPVTLSLELPAGSAAGE
jgi:beta-N-acetylhexosaminidase